MMANGICNACFGGDPTCRVCDGTGIYGEVARYHIPGAKVRNDDLRTFGTEAHPLHASQLDRLLVCPWRGVLQFMFEWEDTSGPAGDTGSAMHAAAAAFHSTAKGDVAAAIRSMVDRSGEFPKADLEEAAALFLNYAHDGRNSRAEVICVERKISLSLPPAPDDPTGERIVIHGTVDQVRIVDGVPRVYDIKTSTKKPRELMDNHTLQVACYVVGASRLLGRVVHPGGLICPRQYHPTKERPETEPAGIFYPYPWKFEDVRYILWGLRHIVSMIRSGMVWHRGNDDCKYCPARSPDNCLPQLKSVIDPTTMRISLPTLADVAVTEQAFDFTMPEDVFEVG